MTSKIDTKINCYSDGEKKPNPIIDEPPKEGQFRVGRCMATIQDGDERLLARIGYQQVSALPMCHLRKLAYSGSGATPGVHQVVYGLLCHLHSWRIGLCPCYLW